MPILVFSMGSGSGCDGQYLFATDILGTNEGHLPRHAWVYRDLRSECARLHREAIAAFDEFRADVEAGSFPGQEHLVDVEENEYLAFVDALSSRT